MSELTSAHVATRLQELDAGVARLAAEIDDLVAAHDSGRPAPVVADGELPLEPVFGSAIDWVHGFFLPTFLRSAGGQLRWCERWSEHAEALLRLEAMWRAWEVLRLDGGLGMSVYLLHHLDPGLAALVSGTGPFAGCTPDRHTDASMPTQRG